MASENASSASGSNSALLGVFARFWQPGKVKTRLAASVGQRQASDLHRHFVEATLTRLSSAPAGQRWVVITPASAAPEFEQLDRVRTGGWRVVPQTSGDLGRRMEDFFLAAWDAAERVVLVGSDSPDLPPVRIAQAFAALDRVPVALGPSADGGYHLVGLRRSCDRATPATMFRDMPWSTPQVLKCTLRRLNEAQIEYELLESWHDVDTWDDLVALRGRLAREEAQDAELQALRRKIDTALHQP